MDWRLKHAKIVAILAVFAAGLPANAATKVRQALRQAYVWDLADLPRGLPLKSHDEIKMLHFSDAMIKARVEGSQKDPIIEAIEISLPVDADERAAFVRKLAQPGSEKALQRYFERRLQQSEAKREGGDGDSNGDKSVGSTIDVKLDPAALPLIDDAELARHFARAHHHLTVPTASLRAHGLLRHALLEQLRPFFSGQEIEKVLADIDNAPSLNVDRELLPAFARRTVGRWTKFRGFNCFHAALSFQAPALPADPRINFNEEIGFHPAMINNDELWYAVTHDFVEIDPRKESLRYGDVIVYLDVGDPDRPVDWHWVKHASAYLFGEYVFSKGSYSPNTPYSVKTLGEEWHQWQKATHHLGVKIFRYAGAPR